MNISAVKPLYSAARIEKMQQKSEINERLAVRAQRMMGKINTCIVLAREIPVEMQHCLKMVACQNNDFFRLTHSNPVSITNMVERRIAQFEVYHAL